MKKMFLFIFLLCFSTVILGIGFAAINNITLELVGNSSVKKLDNITITKVEYKSDVLADLQESQIINYYTTTINSKVVLGDDINSSISYEVTLKNDTDRTFKYIGTVHDDSSKFYDNENIKYEVTGIEPGEMFLPNSEKVITITFKYNEEPIDNNILNSYINIKFNKIFNIEYVNIDSNNLISSIEEGESANIEFINPPIDIDIAGDLEYEYNNGVLSISNVASDLKITGIEGTLLYSVGNEIAQVGSIINPSNYQSTNKNLSGTYVKYTINSNNQVVKIEGCKSATQNANEVCLEALNSDKYNSNKEILATYFGGSSDNVPNECIEEYDNDYAKFTCSNTYVILSIDNNGGVFINDLENNKSCTINLMSEI